MCLYGKILPTTPSYTPECALHQLVRCDTGVPSADKVREGGTGWSWLLGLIKGKTTSKGFQDHSYGNPGLESRTNLRIVMLSNFNRPVAGSLLGTTQNALLDNTTGWNFLILMC